ncbi:MAG: hypothetical protein ACO32I_07745, partial [Candidatus Limnocylindrus sp.]
MIPDRRRRWSKGNDYPPAEDVAEWLVVDSGAMEHLEVTSDGFATTRPTGVEISTVVEGDPVRCDFEGWHEVYVLAGAPDFQVVVIGRPRTVCCPRAGCSLFSVRAFIQESGGSVHFDAAPRILLSDGSQVPFFLVADRYALARFRTLQAAQRASDRMRASQRLA